MAVTVRLKLGLWHDGRAHQPGDLLALPEESLVSLAHAIEVLPATDPELLPPVDLGAAAAIPKLLHFVWTGPAAMPDWAHLHLARFAALNPDYTVKLHGDEVLAPEYAGLFARLAAPEHRADLLRYSALERWGGWYFDLDFLPLRPVADAERAWAMDGRRLYLACQHGHRSGAALPYANAPLACGPGLPLWQRLKDLLAQPDLDLRDVGPRAMAWIVRDYPQCVVAMDWPWWFPVDIASAAPRYRDALARPSAAARFCHATVGQLPFAMHCWARAGTQFAPPPATPRRRVLVMARDDGLELKVNAHAPAWPDGHPLWNAREGLRAADFEVVCAGPETVGTRSPFLPDAPPAAVVLWNGRRQPAARRVAAFERAGIPVWRLEHGFLDRRRFTQCDSAGILHWASWRDEWNGSLPADAAVRLAAVFAGDVAETAPRADGPVLVIGQCDGDTQLQDSPLQTAADLCAAVAAALPAGVAAEFRPHPLAVPSNRVALPLAPAGEPLTAALARARFLVTINSNSLVEAAAAGVPALAVGPSTAIAAGVARQAARETLADDLAAMLAGWHPLPGAGRHYLLHLACRQFSAAELRSPDFWRARIP